MKITNELAGVLSILERLQSKIEEEKEDNVEAYIEQWKDKSGNALKIIELETFLDFDNALDEYLSKNIALMYLSKNHEFHLKCLKNTKECIETVIKSIEECFEDD